MKLAFEAELQASGLRYAIVRPTAFFKSLAGQVQRVRSGKPYLAFGGGRLKVILTTMLFFSETVIFLMRPKN